MYTRNKRSKIAFSSAPFLDCDHEAEAFLEMAQGLETEPERGKRCYLCYELR
jgi:predicted adenine nucleotide alpha hydrolase (AANH) superfamily ATPase